LPDVTRVVVMLHGLNRNANTYFASAVSAQQAAGDAGQHSLLLAPQFLADEDIAANALPPDMLHWGWNDWSGGRPARGQVPASSFDAIDAILARLADRRIFPHLTQVVLAGHSAGGQVVQRYAVLGNGDAALRAIDVSMRYVVANPSSYLYFSADRPVPVSGACRALNRWKYGFDGDLPPYASASPALLERRYATRDVIYLLGGADTDPDLPVLDRSCAAEAQGDNHLDRGLAYFRTLQSRESEALAQHLYVVPGVAHDGRRMFASACGLAALFDKPGCAAP
jgi:pimeloyl-ACP methyl ester carboxylesterase